MATSLLELNATPGYQAFSLSDVLDPGWDALLYDAIIVRSDDPLLAAPNSKAPQARGTAERGVRGDARHR